MQVRAGGQILNGSRTEDGRTSYDVPIENAFNLTILPEYGWSGETVAELLAKSTEPLTGEHNQTRVKVLIRAYMVLVSNSRIQLGENGTSSFLAKLSQRPVDDVNMTFSCPAEVLTGVVFLSTSSIVYKFTTLNWDTWQNVTVLATDDDYYRAPLYNGTLKVALSTNDPFYHLMNVYRETPSVVGTVTDNDEPGYYIRTQSGVAGFHEKVASIAYFNLTSDGGSRVALSMYEAGQNVTYFVRLNSRPLANVTLVLGGPAMSRNEFEVYSPLPFYPWTNGYAADSWQTEQAVVVGTLDAV